MLKMHRKIIIAIILFIIFTTSCGIIYLNNVYLPIKVKGRLADSLSTFLNYNVEIERLKISPLRGAIIQNIVIYDKVKDKENTILTIKEASFHILFLPLIKERKIIIPIIHIDSPYLNVRYRQDNTFNFSRIFLPKPQSKVAPKIKFSFLIYKINIFNGKGIFEDERQAPKFTKVIQNLDIVLGIKQLTKVGFLIESKILADKGGISALSLRGDYNFLSKEFNSKLNLANLVITEFSPYLKTLPLSIAAGVIDNSALEIKFKNNNLGLKGLISAKGLDLKKEGLQLTGDIDIEPEFNYATDKKTLDYKANVKFVRADLNGIQYIEKLSNISGNLGIEKNKISTEGLKLRAMDSDFILKGTVKNFSSPYMKLNLKSEQVYLENVRSVLPLKKEGANLIGAAQVDINIEGFIGRPPPPDIKGTLRIDNAKLQTVLLKELVNNMKGEIDFTRDTVNWVNLTFNYRDTAYTSTGRVSEFNAPLIDFSLISKDIDLKNVIKINDKSIRIIALAGKYLNSQFNIEGAIDTQEKDNPNLSLVINEMKLSTPDAFILLSPALSESLKKFKPEGILNIKGTLNGKAKDLKNLTISLKAASDSFSVYNLKLADLKFNLNQKDRSINISPLTASGYSGLISINFSSDLTPDVPAYFLKLNGSGIDLAKLKSDMGIKDKELTGILDLNADLSGNFKGPESLKGNGMFSIKDGRLWQFNLFKGLGELIFIPDFEKIVFKEAFGDFSVADKSVSTENLKLTSNQLSMDCKGKLGFDGTLNFTIYTKANKNLIRDSADLRKFTAAVLGELGSAMTINVSGTIQKPKYKIVPVVVDLLKNITDFFLGK